MVQKRPQKLTTDCEKKLLRFYLSLLSLLLGREPSALGPGVEIPKALKEKKLSRRLPSGPLSRDARYYLSVCPA